jgi:hypothetical protein
MLRPIRKVCLAERPYYTAVSGDGQRFAACARSGKCWFFDNNLKQLDETQLGPGIQWIQLNKTGSEILVGFDNRIDAFNTTGNIAAAFALPVRGATGSCCAMGSNEQVLCVASWDLGP